MAGSRLRHVCGLLVDCIKLTALMLAIGILQLAALLPAVRRLLATKYNSGNSRELDTAVVTGRISREQRGEHFVNRSIKFDVMLRSTAKFNFFKTFFRWWRRRREWEDEFPVVGVSAGQPIRDGSLLTLECQSLKLSELVKPGRYLLVNFGSCS
jgi:hypothetical protein